MPLPEYWIALAALFAVFLLLALASRQAGLHAAKSALVAYVGALFVGGTALFIYENVSSILTVSGYPQTLVRYAIEGHHAFQVIAGGLFATLVFAFLFGSFAALAFIGMILMSIMRPLGMEIFASGLSILLVLRIAAALSPIGSVQLATAAAFPDIQGYWNRLRFLSSAIVTDLIGLGTIATISWLGYI